MTSLDCKFVKGEDDYINTDVSAIRVCPLAHGGTKAVVRVVHASGDWIKSGEAFQTFCGIELVYHTFNNGVIAFELYGCELQFHLKDIPFDPQDKFTLKNICSDEDPAVE